MNFILYFLHMGYLREMAHLSKIDIDFYLKSSYIMLSLIF